MEVAGDDPGILANAAVALAAFGEDIGSMMALVGRAPSAVRSGWAGQPDIAIEHAEASLRLSPRARIGASFLAIGAAHFFSRRFDEAVPKLLLAIQDDPSFAEPYRFLASCYAHMGQLDKAGEIIERLRAIAPVVVPNFLQFRNPEHCELYLSGLRLAAGEAK